MRFLGQITSWNPERGFGFITPAEGGQDIFVHISQLPRGFSPSPEQAITFEIDLNAEGKKKAVRVQVVKTAGARGSHAREAGAGGEPMTVRRFLRSLVVPAVLLVMILVGTYRWTEQRPASTARAVQRATGFESPAPAPVASPYRCDGRNFCSQMTSCAEATYFLKNCPDTQMDGNNDGVPCESQWCR